MRNPSAFFSISPCETVMAEREPAYSSRAADRSLPLIGHYSGSGASAAAGGGRKLFSAGDSVVRDDEVTSQHAINARSPVKWWSKYLWVAWSHVPQSG